MPAGLIRPHDYYLSKLRELSLAMRERILSQLRGAAAGEMAAVAAKRDGDTIYRIDEKGEAVLLEFCEAWGREGAFVLIAEGIEGGGQRVFPRGAKEEDAEFRMIVNPVDGTRGIMYDKRSAWILAGVAPNLGRATCLADMEAAMQTELPTTRQPVSDVLWAARGQGARAERHDLAAGLVKPLALAPSQARTVRHGFAMLAKFFVGGKEALARLEEELFEEALGPPEDGNPLVFDDQYISTGGQLYELMTGHDRFCADLRPLAHAAAGLSGAQARLCCHPYDLAAELIAREAGVIVTDAAGGPLRAPLNVTADVCWIGYANEHIRQELGPVLGRLLRERGWVGSGGASDGSDKRDGAGGSEV
ncbi:MAG TPA: inositol monophosphatase [Candidatus Brocadiia bacterium]|nr:inositol monophosphatase [Candidatus Brocadiia bacterium]